MNFQHRAKISVLLGLQLMGMICASAMAQNYDFLAAPEIDLNRVYRLDKITGEIGACQYAIISDPGNGSESKQVGRTSPNDQHSAMKLSANSENNPQIGRTLCYGTGEGAGPQTPSNYTLVSTHHERESGVFRVDLRSGTMSICFVLGEVVVCTPAAR